MRDGLIFFVELNPWIHVGWDGDAAAHQNDAEVCEAYKVTRNPELSRLCCRIYERQRAGAKTLLSRPDLVRLVKLVEADETRGRPVPKIANRYIREVALGKARLGPRGKDKVYCEPDAIFLLAMYRDERAIHGRGNSEEAAKAAVRRFNGWVPNPARKVKAVPMNAIKEAQRVAKGFSEDIPPPDRRQQPSADASVAACSGPRLPPYSHAASCCFPLPVVTLEPPNR